MVGEEGFEPSSLAARDFKSLVYTIPPLALKVEARTGFAPVCAVLQTAAYLLGHRARCDSISSNRRRASALFETPPSFV